MKFNDTTSPPSIIGQRAGWQTVGDQQAIDHAFSGFSPAA
jgi:hypothetical protein